MDLCKRTHVSKGSGQKNERKATHKTLNCPKKLLNVTGQSVGTS